MNPEGNIPKIILNIFSGNLFNLSLPTVIVSLLQILIIGYIIFAIYWKTRGTTAQKLINGIVLLIPVVACFYFFRLIIFIWLFELFLPAIVVGIVVLFSPELRRFLTNLGKDGLSWLNMLTWVKTSNKDDEPKSIKELVKEIVDAAEIFSRNKTGALIVFDNTWSDRLYINSGRKLDAVVSTELLLNIFYPKSPLHDGAVLIRNKRIQAASVILPITENPKLNPWQYGTRHRAALGISESNPHSLCLIVSEETGAISLAEHGKIIKVTTIEELQRT
ncbi:MAG: diadenylate cyclase CdaA, partial [Candidatus Caenarcaniphilales bacterium]|nr:diadenylate cyclase CdaA [Candidatus Caenarcaniphilales bacterium]